MRPLADLPIRRKLNALALLSSALGLTLAAAVLISFTWASSHQRALQDLQTLAQISADNSTAALTFGDQRVAQETLLALKARADLESACLYPVKNGHAGPLFASFQRASGHCPLAPGAGGTSQQDDALVAVVEVALAGEPIGRLRLSQSLHLLRQQLTTQMLIALGVFLLCFLLSLLAASFMQRAITGPILRLATAARGVAETRDYQLRVAPAGRDEIGGLIEDFNHMLSYIQASDLELQSAHDALIAEVEQKTRSNQKLENAMQQLRMTQDQLVQSEKMAQLGSLVAGVAHEVNTPIGVGVSAASTLREYSGQLQAQYARGAMTRTELERFLVVADESTKLILNNLARAASLIQSFKQVAVDQSSDERRRFELKSYIEEVLSNLTPQLRRHRVVLRCAGTLWVDSYPGALVQIISNLVNNSLTHAYAPGQAGQITIKASCDDGSVQLDYCDDGHGIAPEHQGKVFDPFFTTRRGQGGSGLGLHIVYNLVTQRLRGRIELASQLGEGVRFRLCFPAGMDQPADPVPLEQDLSEEMTWAVT